MINDIKKVYINGNTVVVKFKNGDSKIAKCHPNDKFDLEKGILLCIAKENGYTYQDITDLSENANVINPSEKRKERLQSKNKVKVKRDYFGKNNVITLNQLFNYLSDYLKF